MHTCIFYQLLVIIDLPTNKYQAQHGYFYNTDRGVKTNNNITTGMLAKQSLNTVFCVKKIP